MPLSTPPSPCLGQFLPSADDGAGGEGTDVTGVGGDGTDVTGVGGDGTGGTGNEGETKPWKNGGDGEVMESDVMMVRGLVMESEFMMVRCTAGSDVGDGGDSS